MGCSNTKQKVDEKEIALVSLLNAMDEENAFLGKLLKKKIAEGNKFSPFASSDFKIREIKKKVEHLQYGLKESSILKQGLIDEITNNFDINNKNDYQYVWNKLICYENQIIIEKINEKQSHFKDFSQQSNPKIFKRSYDKSDESKVFHKTEESEGLSGVQVLVSKQDSIQSMTLDFYMVETFENVIRAFKNYDNTPANSISERETNKIALQIAIDNSDAQFKTCKKQYPPSNIGYFQNFMNEFAKNFDAIIEQLISNDLNYEIQKFKNIIKGEEVVYYVHERVTQVNPHDALAINFLVQKSYNKTDNELEEIKKKDHYQPRKVNINQNVWGIK